MSGSPVSLAHVMQAVMGLCLFLTAAMSGFGCAVVFFGGAFCWMLGELLRNPTIKRLGFISIGSSILASLLRI